MEKILLIDNFDSFTFNLYHYLEELWSGKIAVKRNNDLKLEEVMKFHKIVISPGPGLPEQAGNLLPILKEIKFKKKILGICLGMQAIAQVFDSKLINLKDIVHGQSSNLNVLKKNHLLYRNLPKRFKVGRYHSWAVNPDQLSKDLIVTAKDEHGNIMSLMHKDLPIYAVQYHPESVLSEFGKEIIKNWLKG